MTLSNNKENLEPGLRVWQNLSNAESRFIDKSKFLEKTDWRQYEQERDLRMKELQKKLP